MKLKLIAVIMTICFVLASSVARADAWYQFGDNRPVMRGGVNKLGGFESKSREENYTLEAKLRANNYILVTTDDKDISDEDFELFTGEKSEAPYSEYYDRNDEFKWKMKMYKVFVYRPSFNDAMEQLKTEGRIRDGTKMELSTSTAVVDYAIWFIDERKGKVLNEFNDNIPSWYPHSGYMQIQSTIDAQVTMEFWNDHSYEVFYVKAGEPLTVKVKEGMHVIVDINTVGIPEREVTIAPKNNLVVREDENTIDNPKVFDLTDVIAKYDIPSKDIGNKPDYSWDNKDNLTDDDYMPVESVVVGEPPSDDIANEPLPDFRVSNKLILIVVGALLGGLALWVFLKLKKGGSDDNDEYDDDE